MRGRRIQTGMTMSERIELKIDGMHCDACVRRVGMLLKRVDGVEVEKVVVGGATVTAREGVSVAELERAVEGGGFTIAR
ncbi:MAG: heavy metal transporter [Acidobacteria bacterium]|nr:heavy metal transporter [Acidobacteriota bacterium]